MAFWHLLVEPLAWAALVHDLWIDEVNAIEWDRRPRRRVFRGEYLIDFETWRP